MLIYPSYVRAVQADSSPQLLQVHWRGHPYTCCVLHAAREFYAPEDKPGPACHAHPVYHVVLFTKGENEVLYHDEPCPCRPGTLLLTSPGEPHNFFRRRTGEVTYVEVTFEYRRGDELLTIPFHEVFSLLSGSSLPTISYPVDLDESAWPQLAARIMSLVEMLSSGSQHSTFSGYAVLASIFDIMVQAVYRENASEQTDLASRLEGVRRTIESNYAQVLTIEDLASMAQVSVGHFCREFKRTFGTSPGCYLQQCRIVAAQSLLSATQLSCREIATRVGFADEYYFSRVFKQVAGIPPATYRRRQSE